MNQDIITLYTNGTTVQAPSSVLYNPFPDEDDTPESDDVGKGSDNDEETHSDDWNKDDEEE